MVIDLDFELSRIYISALAKYKACPFNITLSYYLSRSPIRA